MRKISLAVVAVGVAASLFLAGCGPKKSVAQKPPATGGPLTSPTVTASPSPTVKDLTPGNCTLYAKSDAVTLLGGAASPNPALEIGTDGGTKIDVCSYLNLTGLPDVEGASYAVVRYDSAATAFAEAQKVQAEMLGDANEHQWAVTGLTAPVQGAGPLLGGTGTKDEQGIKTTLAVVGTNVGPYLVVALGGSTSSTAKAQTYALTIFQSLAAAAS
jgi:hypothetical protein